jgi:hypothetical protein
MCVYLSLTDAFAYEGMCSEFLAVKHIEIIYPTLIEMWEMLTSQNSLCKARMAILSHQEE